MMTDKQGRPDRWHAPSRLQRDICTSTARRGKTVLGPRPAASIAMRSRPITAAGDAIVGDAPKFKKDTNFPAGARLTFGTGNGTSQRAPARRNERDASRKRPLHGPLYALSPRFLGHTAKVTHFLKVTGGCQLKPRVTVTRPPSAPLPIHPLHMQYAGTTHMALA
jgi:hypothetical protein